MRPGAFTPQQCLVTVVPEGGIDLRGSRGPCRATGETLRRKEVIQPHLPVRLPCYDLAPIADPTFAASVPRGFSQRLRVEPTLIA